MSNVNKIDLGLDDIIKLNKKRNNVKNNRSQQFNKKNVNNAKKKSTGVAVKLGMKTAFGNRRLGNRMAIKKINKKQGFAKSNIPKQQFRQRKVPFTLTQQTMKTKQRFLTPRKNIVATNAVNRAKLALRRAQQTLAQKVAQQQIMNRTQQVNKRRNIPLQLFTRPKFTQKKVPVSTNRRSGNPRTFQRPNQVLGNQRQFQKQNRQLRNPINRRGKNNPDAVLEQEAKMFVRNMKQKRGNNANRGGRQFF